MERYEQTSCDLLAKRNKGQEKTLSKLDLPAPALMSHTHVIVRSGMVQLTFWSKDAITGKVRGARVAVPYDHFMLCARGLVDGHDEQQPSSQHSSEEQE